MYTYQYICIAILFVLMFSKVANYAAFVLLISTVMYSYFILPLPGEIYYSVCGLLELSKGFILNKKYRAVSYLCYILIIVNYYGFALYESGEDPLIYDIICSIILIMQLIILMTRGLLNGSSRSHKYNFMVRIVDFDSRQTRDRM